MASCVNFLDLCAVLQCSVWASNTRLHPVAYCDRKRIASEFLNFQACVSEIIICVNSFLMLLEIWFTEISVTLSYAMGLTITGRPLFQCLICVERYLAVVHPVTFLKYKPLRYKLVCSAVVWCMVISSCLFSIFTGNTHVLVYRGGILLQFLLFFSVNLFCCLAVLITLKKPGPGERGREREEENHMKRRAFYLILIITVTMVFMYAPVILSAFFYLLSSQDISIVLTFSLLCFILAGFVQPVLYLYRVGKLPFLCWSWSFLNVHEIFSTTTIIHIIALLLLYNMLLSLIIIYN